MGAPGWPVPAATAPGGAARSKRTLLVIAAAGAAALVLVVAAVVALGSGHTTKHVTAAAPPTTLTPPTTATPVAKVSLSEGVLSVDDLGGAWTAKGATTALTSDQLAQGPCASPLWAHDVAGFRSQFENGGGGVIHTGAVTSDVREAPSENTANAQAAFVTSSSYATCLRAEAIVGMQQGLSGSGFSLDGVAIDPLPIDISLPSSQAYVITVQASDNSGTTVDVSIDHVELFSGRYEATLNVTTNPGLGIDREGLIRSQTERIVQRLAALPPGGTIVSRGV